LESAEYRGTSDAFHPWNTNLYTLPEIWEKIKKAIVYYPDIQLSISETEEKIIKKVSQCLQDSIQKIKDKERKRNGFDYSQRKNMSYKKQLEDMVIESTKIYKVLE